MSWRIVVISERAKLDYKLNYLVIRQPEKSTKIHLGEIAVLIIENTATSLTSYLLAEMVKRKIKIIFCDSKRSPLAETVPLYGSHNTSERIEMQLSWQEETKKAIWTEIIRYKILAQSQLLEYLGYDSASALLYSYIEDLRYNDETNREGHAAKVYFNALFGPNFSRDFDNVVNSILNYGYTILLSTFNREIVATGYLTQLGLFHSNNFNHFNLSCDLMEPFRPLIDYIAVKQCKYNSSKFDTDLKKKMLTLFKLGLNMDSKHCTFLNAVRIYIRSVFEALETDDPYRMVFFNAKKVYENNCNV